MTFRTIAHISTLLSILFVSSLVAADNIIKAESEAWDDATNADGTGLYWDILREIYEPEGYSLQLHTSSYMRSVGLVVAGQTDIMVGAYAKEIEAVVYPHLHFAVDHVVALAKVSRNDLPSPQQWLGEQSLAGRNVGYIRGYAFAKFINADFNKSEFYDRKLILQSLMNDRLDYVLDEVTDITKELEKNGYDTASFQMFSIKTLPLYFVFHDSPRGQALSLLFDKRMAELMSSGVIKQLYEKWQEDYAF